MPKAYRLPVLRELAWLLGSWAFSFVVVGQLVGKYAGMVDIQLHNTYFVVPVVGLVALLFMIVAPLITAIRVLASPAQRPAATLVLGCLSALWLLVILIVVLIRIRR